MAFRIITVPFDNEREVFPDNELNNFLLDKKINNYRVDFLRLIESPDRLMSYHRLSST